MAAGVLVCKVEHEGDVRRFNVEEPLKLESLVATIVQVFNLEEGIGARLVYTDRDGDNITLSTDEDLVDARAASANQNLIRLRLVVVAKAEQEPRSCWCDNCNTTIRPTDVRFKCGNCANYDLCDACESLGVHDPSHVLLKLRREAQAANGKLPTNKAILTSPLGQAPASTEPPAPAAFNLNSIGSLLSNPGIAQLAASFAAPKTPESSATTPQFDLSALAGMASSILGPVMAQQQQGGARTGVKPELGNIIGSLLAGIAQPPSSTPVATPPASLGTEAETPETETETETATEDSLATLLQLGIPEDQAAQFLELSGGNVEAALELWQQLETID